MQGVGRRSAPQPLEHDVAQLKINFDTLSSPAVALWVNCLNIYSAFQMFFSALRAVPAMLLPVPEANNCSLAGSCASCIAATAVLYITATWAGCLWSQIHTVHWKTSTPCCLPAHSAVTALFLCEVWEHIPSRGIIGKSAHSAQSLCSSGRPTFHATLSNAPFKNISNGSLLDTVQRTAFANSSVNTAGRINGFTEKQRLIH